MLGHIRCIVEGALAITFAIARQACDDRERDRLARAARAAERLAGGQLSVRRDCNSRVTSLAKSVAG
jgi:hypothetical protein